MKNYYKINEISKLYGIGADSLRYYERLGILNPKRDTNGYRLYNLKDMYKLNIIRDLRKLDFSMAQIKEYLDGQSVDNTLNLFRQEEIMMAKQKKELEDRERRIRERIQALSQALTIPAGTVNVKRYEERFCAQLSEHITRDEEMDLLIKKLHRRYENRIADLGNLSIAASVSREQVKKGISNDYYSVFFILEQGSREYEFSLPAGEYLSYYYRGGYGENAKEMQKVLSYAEEHGYRIQGDPFEIYEIDNRYTVRPEEFLTEVQVLVVRDQVQGNENGVAEPLE